MTQMVNIYCLKDPDSGEVCYVGQTVGQVEKRVRQHVNGSSYERSKKALWLREIIGQGKSPAIQVVEQCPDAQADEREAYWITHYYSINPALTNGTVGQRTPRRQPKAKECAAKKTMLNIRLTAEQKQSINSLAREYGKTTTEFVLLMAEYVREKRPTFQIKPTLERGRSVREYSAS